MMYSKDFVELVRNGVGNYYIGIGNPNGNILIVGKEPYHEPNNLEALNEHKLNAYKWHDRLEMNISDVLEYPITECHPLRRNWGRNTWSKYQLLYDSITGVITKKFYVNFLKDVFTTEINDSPSPKTSLADKNSLNQRKELIKKSAFFQRFPVVVLACSNYIENDKVKEINEIFGVTYDGDNTGKNYYSKGNWFYTHHNSTGQKLVIHTRQLSANVSGKMIEDMGAIIAKHLELHVK